MISRISKLKNFIPLVIIISLYLLIRIPLATNPLQHDEVYNTLLYLHSSPLLNSNAYTLATDSKWGWGQDWKKQAAIHPPLLSAFYYFWIRIFGDSEISLHLPAILIGLLGAILIYLIGISIFDQDVGLWATLALIFSLSHIGYSTQAVPAIFESSIILASILLFIKFITNQTRKYFILLTMLNVIGISLFYHYLFYLCLQTVILWWHKKIGRAYAATVITTVSLFMLFFIYCALNYLYSHPYWLQINPKEVFKIINLLPYYDNTEIYRTPTQFTIIIFSLFLFGSLRIIFNFKKTKSPKDTLKLILVLIFVLPFLPYLLLSAMHIRFGNPRNFFYLTPIYFLIVFSALKNSLFSKKMFSAASLFIITFLFILGVRSSWNFWNQAYVEREVIKHSADIEADIILVSYPHKSGWPFEYYANRFALPAKIYPWKRNVNFSTARYPCNDTAGEIVFFNFFGKIAAAGTLAIIDHNSVSIQDKFTLGNKIFERKNRLSYQVYHGPCFFLQRILLRPSLISIFVFKETPA